MIMPLSEPSNRRRNALLCYLSKDDLTLIHARLEPVELTFRMRLQSPNRMIDKVYFPESGLASVVAKGNGKEAEVAIVGNEGMVGLPVVYGADRAPGEIFMQAEGQGYALSAADFRDLLGRCPSLSRTCLLFAHVLSVQTHYTSLANAKGRLEERLARWLLMAQDRLASPEIVLTHEFLALMLAVRRAGVTVAVENFEGRGLISARRGMIVILDRDGLLQCANGLYGAPEAEYERVFKHR